MRFGPGQKLLVNGAHQDEGAHRPAGRPRPPGPGRRAGHGARGAARPLARQAARALAAAGLVLLMAACGSGRAATPRAATASPLAAVPPIPPAASPLAPTQAPPLDPTAAAAGAYRAWMEEARTLHPYAEPVDVMWAVMICESSGDAAVIAAGHHGLFQYSAATWGGAWNPYRDQPILDPRAQIFATAKAWQEGYQSWWGCYSTA